MHYKPADETAGSGFVGPWADTLSRRNKLYPPTNISTASFPRRTYSIHGIEMAPPRGSAAYKKKDGTLALSKDGQTVAWTPVAPSGSQPAVVLHVSKITSEYLFNLSFFEKS